MERIEKRLKAVLARQSPTGSCTRTMMTLDRHSPGTDNILLELGFADADLWRWFRSLPINADHCRSCQGLTVHQLPAAIEQHDGVQGRCAELGADARVRRIAAQLGTGVG